MSEGGGHGGRAKKDECATAPVLARKLGKIGRELRLRLIARWQTLQVNDLGIQGRGAAHEHAARRLLHPMTFATPSASYI